MYGLYTATVPSYTSVGWKHKFDGAYILGVVRVVLTLQKVVTINLPPVHNNSFEKFHLKYYFVTLSVYVPYVWGTYAG